VATAAGARSIDTPPTLTVGQFTAQLDALASAVDREPAERAPRLADSVPALEKVAVRGGTVDVRLDWIRTPLLGAPANPQEWNIRRAELASRLRAMRREAAVASGAARPDGAREALTQVLSARGFENVRNDAWQARLIRRAKEWLADMWERTLGRRVGQRTIAVVLAWTLSIAAIAVLLIWLARAAARRRLEPPLDLGVVTARRTAARELALEAAALARAGRVRDAARIAYRAAVQRLEEEGALRVDDARTPREYLRLLPSPHRRRAALASLTETFERIWYGSRAPAPHDGEAIVALLQDLECLSPDRAN
jgi:Domain of unknown function (DUF4129)